VCAFVSECVSVCVSVCVYVCVYVCVKHYLLALRKPGFANDKVGAGFVLC